MSRTPVCIAGSGEGSAMACARVAYPELARRKGQCRQWLAPFYGDATILGVPGAGTPAKHLFPDPSGRSFVTISLELAGCGFGSHKRREDFPQPAPEISYWSQVCNRLQLAACELVCW